MEHVIKKPYGEETTVIAGDSVKYIQSRRLNGIPWVLNAFSTRKGGVSENQFSSMNLNFARGDDPDNVSENFRRFAAAIGTDVDSMVYSMQTHTTNVVRVGRADRGNGVTRPQRFRDVDGLVTNEPGVCLVTTYADCIPLYFVDVANRAIGLSHSGWRGTVGRISDRTLELMGREFGTKPQDVVCFVGPGICRECYEVGQDVADAFIASYTKGQLGGVLFDGVQEGKYQLDLWRANVVNLLEAGVPEDNIQVTDICTCCNADFLFSHRASKGSRGGLCGFLEIRDL
jgi:hypothetical protein